jgi:predicted metal-binding membrane protein
LSAWLAALGSRRVWGPALAVLLAAAPGWAALVAAERGLLPPLVCAADPARGFWQGFASAMAPPAWLGRPGFLVGWLCMLAAMTPPLLAQPVRRVWRAGLKRRRGQMLAVFGAGYLAVWLAAGPPLLLAALGLHRWLGDLGAPAAAALAAGAWLAAPLRRDIRALAHRAPTLRIFGLAALADAARFGFVTGAACAVSCAPLMFVAMVSGRWQLAAMLAVTVIATVELRLPHPADRFRPRRAPFALPGAARAAMLARRWLGAANEHGGLRGDGGGPEGARRPGTAV